jgi:predicted Zn-dependent protease with MMP-like domain
MDISKEEFEKIVYRKFKKLPGVFKKKLENIEFFVEEERSPNLLGLYHGIPFPARKTGIYSLVMPDKIIIFKSPVEKICSSKEEIEKKIEEILFHEIGHYFGFTEKDLRKLLI